MLTMERATGLGPARVAEVEGRTAILDDGARARLAIPFAVRAGDEVLTIRMDDDVYVIGLLSGEVRIESDCAITLRAPEVRVEAGRFDLSAWRIVEKARDVYRWVSGLFHLRTRRSLTDVEEEFLLRAGTADLRAKGDVNVDGRSINLG